MSNSWFKQWLALKKQLAFLVPVLLLALAFAFVVGKQSSAKEGSADGILVVRSGEKLHCFEIDTKAGKVLRSISLDCNSIVPNGTGATLEQSASVWIEEDALMKRGEKGSKHLIARDKKFAAIGSRPVVLVWGQEAPEKESN